jgi:hypothetical protein
MIINPRGPSGSGKTVLMRRFVDECGFMLVREVHIEGRRQPFYYEYEHPALDRPVFLLGHYNTPCAGADTINKFDVLFDLIEEKAREGHVLVEGLLMSVECNRMLKIVEKGHELRCFHLNLPLDECLDSIMKRRRAKNPDAPMVNPKNTTGKHRLAIRYCERLKEAGVPVFSGNREQCFEAMKAALFDA